MTVKTAVALQLESKTGALAVAAVGVVVFGVRFFAGAGEAFTGVLVLLLFVLVVKAHGGQGNQSRISGAARSSYAIRRSVPGHSSLRAWLHKVSNCNIRYSTDTQTSLRRDRTVSCGNLRGHQSQ